MDSGSSITMLASIAGLILMSAYFSATETAFSALNKVRLKKLASDGNKRAELTLNLAEKYEQLLSTILIGNNIVNITAASLGTVIFVRYLGDVGVSVSTVVITLLVLIFGEISPKILAKAAPEKFAMFSAPIIKLLIVVLTPINYVFTKWGRLVSKAAKTDDERGITEEELLTYVEEAEHDGGINQNEGDLIRSVIEFDDLEAVDILTPRVDVAALPITASTDEIMELFMETGYSRIPIYNGTIDDIIGILHYKDFHKQVIINGRSVRSVLQPAIFIAESMKIADVLTVLKQAKSHIAVITDEFGGTVGIVTLEDILEELVGEIWDEHDEVINEFEEIGPNEFKILCSASIDKMFDLFEIDQETDAATVSGWVIQQLGRIPKEGDTFEYENLYVTVSKTDHRRVLEITVAVNRDAESNEQAS